MLKMKQKSSAKHISSFFIEIILVVFFFSVACAILVQIFGKAYTSNDKADKINSAITKGQTISEVFSSKGSVDEALSTVFGNTKSTRQTNDNYVSTFNKKWETSDSDVFYKVIIEYSAEKTSTGLIKTAKIKIYNKDELLFKTTSSNYLSGGEGLHE